jgi:NAD-dependent histone deacetylase SIR2
MPMQTLSLEHLINSHDQKDFAKRTALHDISTAITKSKKVVVVSGAGISCASGIPVSSHSTQV